METTTFRCSEEVDIAGIECLSVWPDSSCRAEIYSNNVKIVLNPDIKKTNTRHLKLHIKSDDAKEYTIIHLPKWVFMVLTKYFHKSPHVFRRSCSLKKELTTNKAVSLLNIQGGVLVCNSTSNFYFCFVINNFLRKLKKAREEGIMSTQYFLNLCSKEIKLDRTFESQYNDRQTIRSYTRSDNTSVINEYALAPQYVTDTIDFQERQIEYNQFINKEGRKTYPTKNDGSLDFIRGLFVKNKMFVKDYKNLMKTLTNAKSLTEKHEKPMLSEDMLSHLQQMIQHLENQSTKYKCCVCTENWQDCLLPTCMHMSICRDCLLTNRDYGHFTCPICRNISSFYIVDFDVSCE